MQYVPQFQRLLTGLAERLGLDGLTADPHSGRCILLVNGDLTLELGLLDERPVMTVAADLCPLPREREEALMETLLAENLFPSAMDLSFGYDPTSQRVRLHAAFTLADLEEVSLYRALDRFFKVAAYWRKKIPELPREPEGEPNPVVLGGPDLLRV